MAAGEAGCPEAISPSSFTEYTPTPPRLTPHHSPFQRTEIVCGTAKIHLLFFFFLLLLLPAPLRFLSSRPNRTLITSSPPGAAEWPEWQVRSPPNNTGGGGSKESGRLKWSPARFTACHLRRVFVQPIADDLCLFGWALFQARRRRSNGQKWQRECNSFLEFTSHSVDRIRASFRC